MFPAIGMMITFLVSQVEEIVEDVCCCEFEGKISSDWLDFEDLNGTVLVSLAPIHK